MGPRHKAITNNLQKDTFAQFSVLGPGDFPARALR